MSYYKQTPIEPYRLNKKVKNTLFSNILFIGAAGLLIAGASVGLFDWRSNELADQQAAKLVYESNHNISHTVPSTVKPTNSTVTNYAVAPTLPRYLIIPKLSVRARILSVSMNAQGAMESPSNIYDTAWYNKSALPSQLGAMLIDGHISSWTAHGVFYGIKTLQSGDIIDVQGGNGAIFTYRVVETRLYNANNVDMATAMTSINPTKPGLNLISCIGDVVPGTNKFDRRIIVFATLD